LWSHVQLLVNLKTNLCKWCDSTSPVCEEKVCYSNCNLNSYCESPYEICVAIWKQDNDSIKISTLCHNPQLPVENVMVPNYNTSRCIMTHQSSEEAIFYICGCVDEQECNDKLIFENHTNGDKEVIPVAAISLLPPLLVAVMITVIFYLCRTQKQRKRAKDWGQKHTKHQALPEPGKAAEEDEKLSVMTDDNHSSMSFICANNINHNTELLPIELDEVVGKGQFAKVWRAKLNHTTSGQYETVAVKIFPCEEYSSWKNESQIFTDASLKHESVLQFLTAEDRESGPRKEYWIITAYHSRGNLKDYLSRHILSWMDLQKMASSLVNGVAHLHSDYTLPFGSKVQEQPCVDTMRDIVLHGRGRPEIPCNWLVHQGMHFLCDTITECWDHDPEARLTAHCVAERFNLMAQMDCDDILNNNTDNEGSKTAHLSGEHQVSDGNRNTQ
uniref:TGF-beta receptor type-2 n=1 Tax=Chelydra serpentina TaxID=8475 RepID=A0A8C3S6A2_CHESE